MEQKTKKLMTLLLAGIMILGLSAPGAVKAADEAHGAEASYLEKELKMDKNLIKPNDFFSFTFTSKKVNGEAAAAGNMPDIEAIHWNAAAMTSTAGKGNVTQDEDGTLYFQIKASEFLPKYTHAGVYEYEVEERPGGNPNITYDAAKYTLIVYAENGKLDQPAIIIKKQDGDANSHKVDPEIVNEHSEFKFTNKYIVSAGLRIEKNVGGSYGDTSKLFDFTTTLNGSSATPIDDGTTITAKIYSESDTATARTVKYVFKHNVAKADCQLAHGEYLKFDEADGSALPVGTMYSVAEDTAGTNYTPSSVTTFHGVETPINTIAKGGIITVDQATTNEQTVVAEDGASKTVITNTYEEVTPTGILINNLPFILMIGAALAGMTAFVAAKRRKAAR